jgi:hypothetical protein
MTDFWGDQHCPGDHHPEDCPLAAEFDRRGQAETQLHAALTAAQNHVCPAPDWYPRVRQLLSDVALEAAFTETELAGLPQHVAQLRAALTELIHASRGLAFFDQIKCDRWNTAYTRAREAAGLEEEQ